MNNYLVHQQLNVPSNLHGVGDIINSTELLEIINNARRLHGEPTIRNNVFISKIADELDGEYYKKNVVQNLNGTESEIADLTHDQAMLVSMRESKAVRRAVLEKLKLRQGPALPNNYISALEALLESERAKAEKDLIIAQQAPKVAFVDHFVDTTGSKSLRETAKILRMPERAMIDALLRDRALFRQSGNLLPNSVRQREGIFTVKTGAADTGHAFTQTRVTPRGVQWIAERYASELMGDA